MKKVKSEMADELRPEYKRSDFGEIVRGKYANRIKEESNVVLLEPARMMRHGRTAPQYHRRP